MSPWRRQRRAGRLLVAAGRVVIVVALVVGVVALAGFLGEDGTSAPEDGAPTLQLEPAPVVRPRPVPASPPTALEVTPVAGATPSSVVNAGDGQRAVVVDSVVGTFTVVVQAPTLRPRPNHPPVLSGPSRVVAAAFGATPITGITVSDPDDRGEDLGLLLFSAGGRITVDDTTGVRLLVSNGSAWLPIIGTIEDLNAALRGLRFSPGEDRVLHVIIGDFGHGDFERGQNDRLDVLVER